MGGSSSPQAVGWVTGFFVGPLVLLLLVLGLGVVVLGGLVYAGLCAIAGSVLLFLMSRLTKDGRLTWIDAYRPVFCGYLVALMVDGVRTKLVTGSVLGTLRPQYPIETVTTFADVFSLPLIATFMDWLWPGVPVAMVLLAVQSPAYRGMAGVFRSAVLSSIAFPGSLLVPLGVLLALDQRLAVIGGMSDILMMLLAVVALVALYAAIGSLLAAPVFRRALIDPLATRTGALRRPHHVAMLVLAVWATLTWVVMFCVPLFDPYWGLMLEAAAAGPLPTALFAQPGTLLAGLMIFVLLQGPGVWAGAWDGRRLLGPPAASVSAPRILGVTAAAVVTTWPLVAAGAWIIALGIQWP